MHIPAKYNKKSTWKIIFLPTLWVWQAHWQDGTDVNTTGVSQIAYFCKYDWVQILRGCPKLYTVTESDSFFSVVFN